MSSFTTWKSGSTALLGLSLAASSLAPLAISSPAAAQTNLTDIRTHWARPFIERLATENVIAGFPDGTFKPNQPVTRAQFAAIVRQAFNKPAIRSGRNFGDVPGNFWAARAIDEAYRTGFMSGYPGGTFQPNQQIPRVQVLVSLASGLDLRPQGNQDSVLRTFNDRRDIPTYATDSVVATTERSIVVNYPDRAFLNPQETATRADVAAFIYQTLVNQGEFPPVASRLDAASYIVAGNVGPTSQPPTGPSPSPSPSPSPTTTQDTRLRVASNTLIDTRYPGTGNPTILIAPGQTIATELEVATDIRNSQNQILIPRGSLIQGRIQPITVGSGTGAEFVADRIVIGNETYTNVSFRSNVITPTSAQNVNPQTLEGSITTAAAQTILGSILGRPNLGGIFGSVLQGGGTATSQNTLIRIDPATQLDLRVNSDFYVRRTS